MRYLVTGVAGFIDSHLTEALLEEGYQAALLEEKIQVGLSDGLGNGYKLYKNY